MIYIGNHMYILHLVWHPIWRPIFSTISRYITRYPVYNFADWYIANIRYLKTLHIRYINFPTNLRCRLRLFEGSLVYLSNLIFGCIGISAGLAPSIPLSSSKSVEYILNKQVLWWWSNLYVMENITTVWDTSFVFYVSFLLGTSFLFYLAPPPFAFAFFMATFLS